MKLSDSLRTTVSNISLLASYSFVYPFPVTFVALLAEKQDN